MDPVVVVGAGPAGAYCAALLASAGARVVLLDPNAPWEKPCGGAITFKGRQRFRFLDRIPAEDSRHIDEWEISTPAARVKIRASSPMITISRRRLGNHLLAEAAAAGVEFRSDRVERVDLSRPSVTTSGGTITASYIVGADGASSIVRRATGIRDRPI